MVHPKVNLKRRNSTMEQIAAWITENWADIVKFFDRLFDLITKIAE